jgi:hypothetical protein
MMIEITFREFYELKYQEDGFHELYVVKMISVKFYMLAYPVKRFGIAGWLERAYF